MFQNTNIHIVIFVEQECDSLIKNVFYEQNNLATLQSVAKNCHKKSIGNTIPHDKVTKVHTRLDCTNTNRSVLNIRGQLTSKLELKPKR